MTVLWNVVWPVFVVAGVAVLAQRSLHLDVKTLSRATFYLFAPALVFDSLVSSDIGGGEFGQIAVAVLLTTLLLWAVAAVAARLLRLQGPIQAVFGVAILIMNSGNFGLPINLFAFGQEGLARASLYYTVSAMLSSSLGVYLMARGQASARTALRRVAGVPLIYGALLGLALNLGGLTVPEPLWKAVHLLGQASIPAMLLVLGVQLADAFSSRQNRLHLPALAVVAVARLLIAPALAWGVAWVVGLRGLAHDVVVLESAMPTAVITTILATEFSSDSHFAALCALSTTLLSLGTLTLLLNWLL